jgi:putative flippase GtrA
MESLREALARLLRMYRTPTGRKMFRYTMVSVISSGVSFGVLFIVFGVFHPWSEVPSTVFANVVATVPSYYLNRNWAWGKSGRSHLMKEVLPFWSMAAAGITLSILTATLARHVGDTHNLHHFGRTVLVLGANLLAFGVLWVAKFVLFNRLFHHHGPQRDGSSKPPASVAESTLVEV